ncbi:hypothetical protein Tco_0456146 [Tanacetum coccineum]
MEKITELLVQSLKPELSKLLTSHDFSNSLPTELKELPSKFKDITGEIRELKKYVEKLEIELPRDLKEIPTKMEKFNSTVSSLTTQVSELRTLQWELPAEFLVVPGQVSSVQSNMSKVKVLDALPSLLSKAKLALILLMRRRTQDKPQSPIYSNKELQKMLKSPQSEREPINNKGKEAMTHKEIKEEESETDSEPEVRLTGSMVESSKKKHLKKSDFVTENSDYVHFIEEQIKEQKRIEESVKVDLAKKEEQLRKEELVDLLGIDVVTSFYKAKMQYDKYCDKMLNRRGLAKIINCDILTKKVISC